MKKKVVKRRHVPCKVADCPDRLEQLEAQVAELTEKVEALPNGDMIDRLGEVEKAVAKNSKNIMNLTHDVHAVGHEIATVREQLGTDIVMSEDRVIGAMKDMFKTMTEQQGVIKNKLDSRPCILEEEKAAEKAAQEGHDRATDKRHHTKS